MESWSTHQQIPFEDIPSPSPRDTYELEPEGLPLVSETQGETLETTKYRRSDRLAKKTAEICYQRWGDSSALDTTVLQDSSDEILEGGPDAEGDETERGEDDLETGQEDWQKLTSAELGEEGISLWDLLGKGFEEEAASIGMCQSPILRFSFSIAIKFSDGALIGDEDMSLLRAYSLKVDEHLTDSVFNKLRFVFPSAYLQPLKPTIRRIQFLSGFQPVRYDCCKNSCVCFTGAYEKLNNCPNCDASRFKSDGTPHKYFEYLPLIPRLRAMAANRTLATKMRYRAHEHVYNPQKVVDVFDGAHYRSLLETPVSVAEEELPFWFFSDPRDVALGLSTDGFAPFKHRKATAWPIVLYNYNLPPDI